MGKFGPEIKVGVVAFIIIVLIVFMSLRVNDVSIFKDKGNSYYTDFDNITGILLKTPVYIYGIKSGNVSAIQLVAGKARITISGLGRDIILYENAVISIKDKGILGERVLEIYPGTPDFSKIASGGEIKKSISSSNLDQMFAKFNEISSLFPKFEKIATNIEEMTNSLLDVIGEKSTMRSLEKSVRNMELVTSSLQNLIEDLRLSLKRSDERIDTISLNVQHFTDDLSQLSMESHASVKRIIENLEKISTRVENFLAKSEDKIDDNLDDFRDATKVLDESLQSLKNIVTRIEKGQGTVGKLLQDESVIEKIEKSFDGVNYFIDTYTRLQTSLGYTGEYLSDEKEFQHTVSLKIEPKPDKYFLFEFIDQPAGDKLTKETTLTIDDQTPVVVKTKTVTDEFSVSAQFAKRFYDFVFRAGLFKSEGGLALDYYLFRDKFKLSFEAFDFGREENPHLRALASLYFMKYLKIAGGSDDLINQSYGKPKDYFIGAGLEFTDDDIKTVLGSIPIPGF